MLASLLALAAAEPGYALPPGSTAADQGFAYGAIVLTVALIWWQSRSSKDPPPP